MSESYRSDNEDVEEDVEEDAEQTSDSTETASEMLRKAREEKGLSQKEVADQLFLTETFVRYIDDGEFHKIPKQPFVKGYLRSYARVVNLSGDKVVACYQKGLDENEDTIEPRDLVEESPGINNFTGPVLQTGLAGLAGLIVIIALVWWLVSDGDSEAPITSTT
ncbi:MAG: helix-turn-helix domain-containing protein, partial [Pseudomonadales bacterium]